MHQGRFSVARPEGAVLFLTAELGGRPAALARLGERVAIPEDGRLDLEARWPPPSVLHVHAADTRAPVSGIDVHWASSTPRIEEEVDEGGARHVHVGSEHHEHPGEVDERWLVVRGASSPIRLAPRRLDFASGAVAMFVRAPGYAWTKVVLDFLAGGERVAVLERAGDLAVGVRGVEPADRLWLRVRRPPPHMPLLDRRLRSDGVVSIAGLPAGTYAVGVETGHWLDHHVRPLVAVEATVVAGETTAVELVVPAWTRPARVPVGGTLVLPPPWCEGHFGLTLELLDPVLGGSHARSTLYRRDLQPVDGRDDAWSWRVDDQQPGRYRVQTMHPHWTTYVDVGPEGRTDLVVSVPPPGHVVVRVLDDETGRDADLEAGTIVWSLVRPDWVRSGSGEVVVRDPATATFAFDAPQGEIEVGAHDVRYVWHQERVTVRSGTTETTIRLRPACGAIIFFEDGSTRVPSHEAAQLGQVTRLDVEEPVGVGYGFGGHSRGQMITVPQAGTYRVTFRAASSYRPIADVVVVVPPGRFVEQVVRLERAV